MSGAGDLSQRAGSALLWRTLQVAGAKVISLVRFLVLARLLVPDDFGLLAIGTVTIAVLVAVTDVGMVPALVQRREADRAHYDSAWTVNALRGAVVALVVVIAAPWIAAVFGDPRATGILRLLALQPLLQSLASIRIASLTRDLRFRSLSGLNVGAALLEAVVAISLAPLLGVWAMVAGVVAGAVGYLVASYVLAPYRPRVRIDRRAAGALLRFGRWVFAAGVVTALGDAAIRAVVARRLGTAELGLFVVASRLAYIPWEITHAVVGQVAFPVQAGLQHDDERATRSFHLSVLAMLVVLLPAYALLVALAPGVVEHVLGGDWLGAEPVLRVLAVACGIGVLSEAVAPLLTGRGRPARVFLMQAAEAAVAIGVIWVLAAAFGVTGAAVAVLIGFATMQLLSAVLVRDVLSPQLGALAAPAGAVLAAAAAGAAAAIGVDAMVAGLPGLVLAVAVGVLVDVLAMVLLDRLGALGLLAVVGRAFPVLAPVVRRVDRGLRQVR